MHLRFDHQWMYDHWSLRQLLEECGFFDIGAPRASRASRDLVPTDWIARRMD